MFLLVYIIGIFTISGVYTLCPHEELDLNLWSESASWPGNAKPIEGHSVTISTPILLNEPPSYFTFINITETGRLVFDPRLPLHLTVDNMHVYGSLIIGSEDCLYKNDLKITLTGTRQSQNGEQEPKVILINAGATLEIHGDRKLSWTKINSTMVPLRDTTDTIFEHDTYDPRKPTIPNESWNDRSFVSGIAAYVMRFDAGNPMIKAFEVYDLVTEGDLLASLILSVQTDEILMLANQHNIRLKDDKSQQLAAFDALETLVFGEVTMSSKFRHVAPDDTYALVYHKGTEPMLSEESNPLGTDSMAHVTLGDRVFLATVNGFNNPNNQLDNFKILTINGFTPMVNAIDDVTSWMHGDVVVFASTDYDWEQAEERTVVKCLDCNNTQFRINKPLDYVHWGEFLFERVDMRAEVGVLTRNVVIEGEMQSTCPTFNGNCKLAEVRGLDTFGGHIKILRNFNAVHIEGVELRNMGQQTDNGRYPIHFHMCLDTNNDPYVKESSIHNTFARCITIHGSNDIQLIDNFCYNHMGHGYFLEDGAEMNNTLDGNLAMTTRKATGTLEPVDKNQPSAFWITNPNNRFINNHGAGGEGNGAWFVYPDEVLSPMNTFNVMDPFEARSTPILEFYNNVGHSNAWVGIQLGSRLSGSRTLLAQNTWQPRADPKDPSSKPLKFKLKKMTGFKNRRNNIWIEAGMVEVSEVSSSDSLNGITLTNDGLVDMFTGTLTDSVVVGDSVNVGVPTLVPGRSIPLDVRPDEPHSGITLWKGPTKHRNIWFGGDFYNDHYDSAAIAMKRFSPYFLSMQVDIADMYFSFDDKAGVNNWAISGVQGQDPGWRSRDGAFMAGFTFHTNETGFPQPAYIVRSDHLSAAAKDCRVRENWRFAVCSTKYGNLKTLSSQPAIFVRHDVPSAQLLFSMAGQGGPQVTLDGSKIVTVHFATKIPGKLVFTGEGMEAGDVLIFGVCLPRDAKFNLRARIPSNIKSRDFVSVNSLDDLTRSTSDDGFKYYHDKTSGMMFYKMIDTRVKSPNEMHPCVNGQCPDFVIDKIRGSKNDADCRERYYKTDISEPLPVQKTFNTMIPRNAGPLPNAEWGAGSTRPFTTRKPVNGGYGEWGEWSTCSKTCGDGTQTRTRQCNNPLPANGGRTCRGDNVDIGNCLVVECPVDGAFTEWTTWGDCDYHAVDDCQGTQLRTRTCTNPRPQYLGVACTGAIREIQPCNKC